MTRGISGKCPDDISEAKIAWFAGWLCADGSIKIDKSGTPRIRFVICDKDPLDKFSEIFGNSVHGPYAPSGLGKKPRYEWTLAGMEAVKIIRLTYPWLSDRYREKADRALTYSILPHRGKKLNPDQVATIRMQLAQGKSGTKLAAEYGVTDGLISAIKGGRIWSPSKGVVPNA